MIATLAGMILGVVRGVRFRARGRPSAMLAGEAEVYYDERTGAMRVRTEASDSALGGSGGGGTTDHAALASNLAWGTSGHTGTASRLAGFGGGGATAYYQIGVDVQAYDADLATIAGLAGSRGAIMVRDSGGSWSILSLGTSGQVLQSNGTDLIFGAVGGGMLGSILTTRGDTMARDATTVVRLPIGASGYYMRSDGVDNAWAALAAADLTGTVGATHGGTGYASYAVGDLLYADSTTTLAKLAAPASGSRVGRVVGWSDDSTIAWVAALSFYGLTIAQYTTVYAMGADNYGIATGGTLGGP